MSRLHPSRARSVALTEAGEAAIARDLDRGRLPGQGPRLAIEITAAGLAAMAAFEHAQQAAMAACAH